MSKQLCTQRDRHYVEHLQPDAVVVKLDLTNAFGTIRRDTILEAVASSLPEACAYVYSSSAASSNLIFGNHVVESSEGVQQGDPLGPLLFCLAIHPLLTECTSELRIGYLDDITLGGETLSVANEIVRLRDGAAEMGLFLNERKCEVIAPVSISPLPT